MSHTFAILNDITVFLGPLLSKVEAGTTPQPDPYRPSEWTSPAAVSITVPSTSAPASADTIGDSGLVLPGSPAFKGDPAKVYVFDCVERIEHARMLRVTRHPIQTSATSPVSSISDHAYQEPPSVTLEIGMSDVMPSFADGMWTGNESKSVAAYETLVDLHEKRALVTLTTRLDTYANMIVESVRPTESAKTLHGLKATVVLTKIFLGSATAVSSRFIAESPDESGSPVSARPNATDSTPIGTAQTSAVTNAITQQHLSGGSWSSVNVSKLSGLLL